MMYIVETFGNAEEAYGKPAAIAHARRLVEDGAQAVRVARYKWPHKYVFGAYVVGDSNNDPWVVETTDPDDLERMTKAFRLLGYASWDRPTR